MEVRVNKEKSMNLDSTLTLIDTISNRLQLVSHDYRGLNNLELELDLLRKLLLRAGYLRKSLQSSLLFSFFEELRHFYFCARADRIYLMVEDIANFRESVKTFQQQFCEWNTCLLDEILDKLQLLVPEHPWGDHGDLIKLKVELKLIKMFYLCTINSRNQASHEFFLSKIRCGIYEKAVQFYYHLLKLEDSSVNHELPQGFSSSLKCCKPQISELYASMSDPLLQSNTSPWLCSDLIAFSDTLLKCLGDIIVWGEACDPTIKQLIDPVQMSMRFLKNFIRFATLGVENPQIFERFFIHCQVSAIKAACLGYMSWFYRDEGQVVHELLLKISELVENIKPVNDQVIQNYIGTLMTARRSRSSFFLIQVPDMYIGADFVDSLLCNLGEFLNRSTNVMVSLDDQIWMIAERLEFVRTIRKQKEETFNGLNQEEKEVVIAFVNEAAIIIFQLYMPVKDEILGNEINVRMLRFLEKVDFIEAELAGKFSTAQHTDHLLNNDTIVGFDVEAEDIKNKLIRGSVELDIVGIEGMVGVGKTTLAKKVYHNSAVIKHFHISAWCDISGARSREKMLLEILHCIVPSTSIQDYLENGGSLDEAIHKHLDQRRYLVVLDNIGESEAWNLLKSSFPHQSNGSRILLTSPKIQPIINCGFIKSLQPLGDGKCLELLELKLAYNEQHFLQFQPLWLIAKLCRGLPLIVVTIAGILANLEQVAWKEVTRSMIRNSNCAIDEYVHNVLELAYECMPFYLKPCLVYMAEFPEGQEIWMERIMWLWIAEGFVFQKNKLKGLEDTAEDYVMALIKRNFIRVAKQGCIAGEVKTCRMHDSVRKFCLAKSKEESFLHESIGEDIGELSDLVMSPDLHRLFIYSQPQDFAIYSQPQDFAAIYSRRFLSRLGPFLLFHFKGSSRGGRGTGTGTSRLRSLLFHSKGVSRSCTSYNLSFFFCLKLLRVLDLGQINVGLVFPSEITTLVQLRYLAVLGVMKEVPDSIVNLSNLETLVLTTYYNEVDFLLPHSLWYIENLRHLHVHGSLVDLSFVKDNLDVSVRLDYLDTCSTLKLLDENINWSTCRNFPRIRKLKCCVLVSGRSTAPVDFSSLFRLQSLKLILDNVERFHINFRFPSNLKKLTLLHFFWPMISTIRELPQLEVLKLLQAANDGIQEWEMKKEDKFPNLKFLKLGNSDIVSWTDSGSMYGDPHFPRLQTLVLEGCPELQELPFCLRTISTLELIKVQSCPISVRILVEGFWKDRTLRGDKSPSILLL